MQVQPHYEIGHQPKKWKEHFLELLMNSFIVVEFFAENLREHLTDRAKKKQYIEEFMER